MNLFYLMNKEEPVMMFKAEVNEYNVVDFTEIERFDMTLPIGFYHIHAFLEGRRAPKNRQHIEPLLQQYGCTDLLGFVKLTHALSLNDTFWVKEINSNLSWEDVSLYRHPFDEVIAQAAFEGGFAGGADPNLSPEFGTDGTFPKCWVREEAAIYLYKAGSVYMGLEPYSEFYSAQLASELCPNVVDYDLGMHRNKLISKCSLFTSERLGYIPYQKINPRVVSVKEIIRDFSEIGCEDEFRRMIVLDALILNTDRHLGNFGFLADNDTQQILCMAPVFDHNQALLPYMNERHLNNIGDYLSNRVPVLGDDFNTFANAMLTPAIKSDLINLHGFEFEKHNAFNLPEKRIELLENIVNRQIGNILKNRKISLGYWNFEEEKDFSEELEEMNLQRVRLENEISDEIISDKHKITLAERIKDLGNKHKEEVSKPKHERALQ